MTIVTEDGTGRADAVSLCSVADADSYHQARGNSAWTDLDVPDKESALVRATDFITQIYRERWKGYRTTNTQALDWPRAGVVLADAPYKIVGFHEVPTEVKSACAMLALRASTEELAPDLDREVESEKIDVIEIKYRSGSRAKQYRAVDMLLTPLLKVSMSGTSIVRA
jgi:hypothetical protein